MKKLKFFETMNQVCACGEKLTLVRREGIFTLACFNCGRNDEQIEVTDYEEMRSRISPYRHSPITLGE